MAMLLMRKNLKLPMHVQAILKRMANSLETENLADVKALIEELGIADPDTGSKNWTEVRQFNLMFGTKLGAEAASAMDLYLRPETAQGIFVNFLNVQKTGRMKIPFGIAQTGKAFRNEIVARQFIFRMREFEQMEMQFFVRPGEEMKYYEYWKDTRAEITNTSFKISFTEADHGKHFLLVDDVITTGATLEACGRALLTIPNSRLSIVTMAYAHT